jgi:MarR family transcriptional repressor of emrRAB
LFSKGLIMAVPGSPIRHPADPRDEFPMDLPEYIFHLQLFSVRCRTATLERTLAPIKLTTAQHRTLAIIEWFQPCTMRELAEFCIVDRTAMTRTVDCLVEAGWVDRERSAQDRREVMVTLTPAGLDKVQEGNALIQEGDREALVGISESDQRALIRVAQQVFANLAPDTETRERVLKYSRRTPQTS